MFRGQLSLPLWVAALLLAAVAPFVAKALGSMFEKRSRERSQRLLLVAKAGSHELSPEVSEDSESRRPTE